MVDPISLTVATLLAQKAAEALAGEAGKSAWAGLQRLADLVRGKLQGEPSAAEALVAVDANPADSARVLQLAQSIDARAGIDPGFREQLEALIAEARRDRTVGQFVTEVYGNAQVGKLVSIGEVKGDVSF